MFIIIIIIIIITIISVFNPRDLYYRGYKKLKKKNIIIILHDE